MSEVWTKLRASLTLDPTEYKAGAKEVSATTTSMTSTIMKAAGAMGVAFSAAEVIMYGKELVKAANASVDAARGLGITTAALAGLQRVAERNGVPGEKVIAWLQKLEDVSADLAMSGGTSGLGKQLEAMGINVREFLGLPVPERLMLLITKSNESALGVSALNAALGKGAAIDAKDAYSDLARNGLASISAEAAKAGRELEILSSIWENKEKAGSGLKGWTTSFLASIVEEHRAAIAASRDSGGGTPQGMDKFAEGVGSVVMDFGVLLSRLIPPLHDKLVRGFADASATSGGGKFRGHGASGSWGPTDEQVEFDKAEAKRLQTAKASSDKAVKAMQDANGRLRSAALEGEEKIQAELAEARRKIIEESAQAQKDMEDKLAEEKNQEMRRQLWDENVAIQNALRERLRIVTENAEAELQVLRGKRDEALSDAAAKQEEIIRTIEGKIKDAEKGTKGFGINADSMARIGGFMGGERPGLAVADKQLRVQEEIRDLLKAKDLAESARDNLTNSMGQQTGGVYTP